MVDRQSRLVGRDSSPHLPWRRASVLAVLAVLAAACAPPGYDGNPLQRDDAQEPIPDIAPLTPLLATARVLPDSEDPDPDLRRRGEALQRSAQTQPATDSTDLLERGADLRRRADEVRASTDP